MKKIFILTLIFILNCGCTSALEIVYPKQNPAKIDANSTFFIGSTKPTDTLTINGDAVKVHPNGSFTYVVPLMEGDNEFKIISTPKNCSQIKSDINSVDNPELIQQNLPETIDFIIQKPAKEVCAGKPAPQLIPYTPSTYKVKKDGAPLRTTPADWGINRLSHLPQGMSLLVNGEKGDFYRVILGSKAIGWIMKTDVEKASDANCLPPAQIKGFKHWENPEFCYYYFIIDRKTPYAVKEENGLKIRLYDVELSENAGNLSILDNVATYNIPVNQKLLGYEPYFDGNNLCLKVRKIQPLNIQKPLSNIKILIDPGHGGSEFGAIGPLGGKEKDINLAIAKNVEKELIARGADVVMTRENDSPVSLSDRVKMAKDKDCTLSVSIHANALPDGGDPSKSTGTGVYYYHNQAKPLAQSILTSMTQELGVKNNGTIQASFALVRPTNAVSVLVETAYIINPDDYALLTDENFQRRCAKAIADGIERYLSGECINLR